MIKSLCVNKLSVVLRSSSLKLFTVITKIVSSIDTRQRKRYIRQHYVFRGIMRRLREEGSLTRGAARVKWGSRINS